MDLELGNQVVFVAGSSRGIGKAIASELLAEGACVILTGRDERSLRLAVADLKAANGTERVFAIAGDLLNATVAANAFNRAVGHFGMINHVVINLGSGKGERGWELPDSEWLRLFDLNLFASVRLAQTAVPHLLANPYGGSVLFIASIVGLEATPAPLPYSAAKAALLSYSKNLSRELAPEKIRVNSIAPGNILFDGGSWHERVMSAPKDVERILKADVPQQRLGSPADVAKLAAFLCSSASGFTTGSCFVADGGQTRRI